MMVSMRCLLSFSCLFISSAVSTTEDDIQEFMACMKDKDAALVSAHRGGPAPGFPENAIETLDRGRRQGVRLFEIDTARGADGTLYLMHDKSLDRTTTGSGLVGDITQDELASLSLEDNAGALTPYKVPTLRTALQWAKANDAFLNLDVKNSAPLEEISELILAEQADHRVMIIAGSLEKAAQTLDLLPRAMATVSLYRDQSLQDILDSGLDTARLAIWAGFRRIDKELIAKVDDAGIAVSFGTLGFGNSFDDQYAALADNKPYGDLAKLGVTMIATDRPIAARNGLLDAGLAWDSGIICD